MNRILQTKSIVASAATAAVLIGGGATAATAMASTGSGGAGIHPATAARTSPTRTADDAATSCGGIGFTVLHNDRSGGLVLPAGPYRVSSPNLGCKTASAYFTEFLDKYQGPIPGWTGKQLGYGYGTYTNNRTKQNFTVKYVGAR